jgi:hypothetical protein
MLKAQRFIEPDGRYKLSVRLQIEPVCARGASFCNRPLEKAASDAGTLARFCYGHFGYFKFTRSHGEQSAAANRLAIPGSQEDSAAAIQNGLRRIGERCLVLRFQGKVADNLLLVEPPEGSLVPRPELADGQFYFRYRHKSRLLHPTVR